MRFIKKNTSVFTTVVFLLLLAQVSIGQNTTPSYITDIARNVKILPPAPEAAALGRYGGINVGLSTGTLSKEIPLYKFVSRGITVPISLTYTGTGLKVDEISSRTGHGWALNAGGVINRTVFGNEDEATVRLSPPGGTLARTRPMLDFLENVSIANMSTGAPTYDAQPDVFSFNFGAYDGQFVLDTLPRKPDGSRNWKPIILNHSGVKIEWLSDQGNYNTYKATAPDGIQYYFADIDYTQSYDAPGLSSCGNTYYQHQGIPTAWYLTKIINPNIDTVYFTYTRATHAYISNVSQTLYHGDALNYPSPLWNCNASCGSNNGPEIPSDKLCISMLQTDGPVLSQIASSSGGKIIFNHSERSDQADRLLNSIEVHASGTGSAIKKYNLFYNEVSAGYNNPVTSATELEKLRKRYFLTAVDEVDAGNTKINGYKFNYYNLTNLPSRMAYAKDHWGYFNGKPNTSYIPRPLEAPFFTWFSRTNANRDPDALYSQAGMLSSIQYPTGAYDSIEYEGNQLWGAKVVPAPDTTRSIFGYSNGGSVAYYTISNIQINYGQQCNIYGQRSNNTVEDSALSTLRVTLARTESPGTVIWESYLTGNATSFSEDVLLGTGSYNMTIEVVGLSSSDWGEASIVYKPNEGTPVYQNINAGGVRVFRSITDAKDGSAPIVKTYKYTKFEAPGESSGDASFTPRYLYRKKIYLTELGQCIPGSICENAYFAMYSNSIDALYIYGSLPVYYSSVTEQQGLDGQAGETRYKYQLEANHQALSYMGDEIIGVPSSDCSLANGREISKEIYKNENGQKILSEKTETHYKHDPRASKIFYGYVAERNYAYPLGSSLPVPADEEWNQFNLAYYARNQYWIYADYKTTAKYNSNGTVAAQTKEIYAYNNPQHAQLNNLKTINSRGDTSSLNIMYPLDYPITGVGTDNIVPGIKYLQDSWQIAAPVEQYTQYWNSGSSTKNTSAGIFTTYNSTTGFPETKYLLSEVPLTGFNSSSISPSMSMVRDARYKPRAVITRYNPFGKIEEQQMANGGKEVYLWGYNSLYPVAKIIGSNYTAVMGSITQAQIDAATSANNDNSVRALLNGLRTALAGDPKVQVVSYTYRPQIGMTSETDPTGRTTFYEYDAFGRLSLVKDEDGNILKRICYNYAGQVTDCGSGRPLASSAQWVATGNTRCVKDGSNNNTGYQEREERDNNTGSATYNQVRWVNMGSSTSTCPLPSNGAYWQATGNTRCVKDGSNNNTGIQEREERDQNTTSATYNQTRWVSSGTNTTACPLPSGGSPDWQVTGNTRCVKDGSNNNNTGIQEREERDQNTSSATYNQTRWVSTGTNTTACPLPNGGANWQATGNTRCVKDGSNNNTGYQEREERDNNTGSATYNQTRWVSTGENTTACPVPATAPNWQPTGAVRCEAVNNINTGNQERKEVDMNSASATYMQERWVSTGANATACPLNYRSVSYINKSDIAFTVTFTNVSNNQTYIRTASPTSPTTYESLMNDLPPGTYNITAIPESGSATMNFEFSVNGGGFSIPEGSSMNLESVMVTHNAILQIKPYYDYPLSSATGFSLQGGVFCMGTQSFMDITVTNQNALAAGQTYLVGTIAGCRPSQYGDQPITVTRDGNTWLFTVKTNGEVYLWYPEGATIPAGTSKTFAGLVYYR